MTPTSTNLSGFRSTAFIGLGSNLGNPIQQIQHAFREIDEMTETSLVKVSSLYESAPIGFCDQPAFINAVVEVSTTLSPHQLMQNLLSIENDHGRTREQKNGPRTLDLDILLFNNWIVNEAAITTPHPRAHERAFVLLPLLEIAPDIHIPGIGYARDFLSTVAAQTIRRLDDEAVNVNLSVEST